MNIEFLYSKIIEEFFEVQSEAKANCKVATFDKGEVILPCFSKTSRIAIFIKDDNKSLDPGLVSSLCKINVSIFCIKPTKEDFDFIINLIDSHFAEKTKEIESYYPDEFISKVKKTQNYYPKLKDQIKLLSDREQIELAKKIYPADSKLLKSIISYYSPDSSGFSPADRDRVKNDMEYRKWQLKIEGYKKEDLDNLSNEELMNLHQQVISSKCLEPQDDIDGDYDEGSADNA